MSTPSKILVYNYGSNGVAQLRARCRNPGLALQPATAKGLARVFCLQSPRWFDGGVASLALVEGAETLGSVVSLSPAEKLLLDGYEKPAYREVEVEVDVGGNALKAVAYVAGDGAQEWTPPMRAPPSEAYLTAIAAHLRSVWRDEWHALECRCSRRGVVDRWAFPREDPRALSLEALAVEVNDRRREPWVMPAAIGPFAASLRAAGVPDVASLAARLAEGLDAGALRAADDLWDADALEALRNVPLHRVFVYGSLLKGLRNARYLGDAAFLGEAATAGSFLLVANGPEALWPYAVAPERAGGRATLPLKGELYLCSTADLDRLDALEDHPTFYTRRTVALAAPDQGTALVDKVVEVFAAAHGRKPEPAEVDQVLAEVPPRPASSGGGDAWLYVLEDDDEVREVRNDTLKFPLAVAGSWRAFLDFYGRTG